MVDPSLFMIPYDRALCEALESKGVEVRLFGRPLRDGEEAQLHGRAVEPVFYHLAEGRIMRRSPRRLRLAAKGLDHVVSLQRLARELREWKADVIHFQWFPLPMVDRLFIPKLRKVAPVVTTVHDSTPFNTNPSSRFQRVSAYEAISRCDLVIVHTEKAVSVLAGKGVPRERILQVPCGILGVATEITAPSATGDEARAKVRFLQFGIIKPYKGVDLLLRAVAHMPSETKTLCEFLVAGKPAMDVTRLVRLRAELGIEDCLQLDFRFFSEEEMRQLLAAADVHLFPYREIDASGVLYAALPYGRPVVASRIGIFEELLRDGVHGCLTDPEDIQGLAAALELLAMRPEERKRMGMNMLELSRTVTDWEEIAVRTLRAYAACANRKE